MPGPAIVRTVLFALAGMLATTAAAAPAVERTAVQVDQLLSTELGHSPGELAPVAADATFLRRAYLDTVGDIPPPEAVTAFLLDPAPDKRRRVVQELLSKPQYGQNWARYWRDVVMYRRLEERALLATATFTPQLTRKLNDGVGWDAIATQMITATGDLAEEGSTALIAAQEGRTEEVAAEVSRIFLGIQIQCAQCHDHPWDSWKREQFHELAAFFPRIALRPKLSPVSRSFEVVSSDREPRRRRPNANVRQPQPEHYMPDMQDPQAEGTRVQPRFFLTGATLPTGTPDAERRGKAAEWITGSPWFGRATVNRVWAELVGEPLFETIDDIGPDRQAKAPGTLDLLAAGFADSGYDLKWLVEVIMATDAYQRESRPRRTPDATPMTASVAQRLRGDQLYNALLTALELDESGRQARLARGGGGPYQRGVRPVFNAAFGFDPSVQRETVTASIPQALALMNTPQINRAVEGRRGTMLAGLLDDVPDDAVLVDELYLRCLSRLPTDEERDSALAFRQGVGARRAAFEDLLWALVNSAEFAHRR